MGIQYNEQRTRQRERRVSAAQSRREGVELRLADDVRAFGDVQVSLSIFFRGQLWDERLVLRAP